MLSKPLLTLHEVADLLKVKESTVRSWIRDKSLRAVKFGREWRVTQKDLELFLEAHANRPADDSHEEAPEPKSASSVLKSDVNGHDPARKRQ